MTVRRTRAGGRKPSTKAEPWIAPKEEHERALLRAKADKRWPHPSGTPVIYYPVRRGRGQLEGNPEPTRTRTISFYSNTGDVVVFLEWKSGYVLTSHLVVRELPVPQPHWSETA